MLAHTKLFNHKIQFQSHLIKLLPIFDLWVWRHRLLMMVLITCGNVWPFKKECRTAFNVSLIMTCSRYCDCCRSNVDFYHIELGMFFVKVYERRYSCKHYLFLILYLCMTTQGCSKHNNNLCWSCWSHNRALFTSWYANVFNDKIIMIVLLWFSKACCIDSVWVNCKRSRSLALLWHMYVVCNTFQWPICAKFEWINYEFMSTFAVKRLSILS